MIHQAKNGLAASAIAGLLMTAMAEPANAATVGIEGDGPDLLQIGGGYFDVRDDDREPVFGLEYRFGKKLAFLTPAIGVLANTDGGVYGHAGFQLDIALGPISITPGLAAGFYREGDSKDLGGPFAFRQSINIAYRLPGDLRLGVLIAHISNASIYDDNPGQEDAQVTLAIPIGPLFD